MIGGKKMWSGTLEKKSEREKGKFEVEFNQFNGLKKKTFFKRGENEKRKEKEDPWALTKWLPVKVEVGQVGGSNRPNNMSKDS